LYQLVHPRGMADSKYFSPFPTTRERKPGSGMMKQISLFLLTLIGIFLLFQCTKKKGNPVGSGFYQRANIGTEADTSMVSTPADTFFQTTVITGESPFLYVGQANDIDAMALIKFHVEVDSGIVDSGTVTIYPDDLFDGTAAGISTISVHEITGEWDEATVTWENFTNSGLLGNEIATFNLDGIGIEDNPDTMSVSFQLPIQLLQTWADTATADLNFGFALKCNTNDYITRFYSDEYSLNLSKLPVLSVYFSYTTDTTKTTYSVNALDDAFIANKTIAPRQDRLIITDGTGYKSALYFDVNAIPADATINGAFLTLYTDTLLSFPFHESIYTVTAYRLLESPWDFDNMAYDSTMGLGGFVGEDSLSLNLSFFVQSWTVGDMENHGIILKSADEKFNLYERAFISTTPDVPEDSLRRPKLHIYYSLPPSSKL